jgi:hypothetical protein
VRLPCGARVAVARRVSAGEGKGEEGILSPRCPPPPLFASSLVPTEDLLRLVKVMVTAEVLVRHANYVASSEVFYISSFLHSPCLYLFAGLSRFSFV